MATKIGQIERKVGFMYYVDGDGTVVGFKRGTKTKTKIATFKRPEKCLCYVDGAGAVLCQKR